MRMIWKGNLGELQFENKIFTRCEETFIISLNAITSSQGSEEEGDNEPDKDGFTKLTKAEQLELPFGLLDREKG